MQSAASTRVISRIASQILDAGPPPLTQEAADSAIDVIDFMAAAVRGVDLIEVTPAVRETWRNYLAAHYPLLTPMDRYSFANAAFTLNAIQTGWQQLLEPQRDMYRQAWAASLPALMQFVNPALVAAGSIQDASSAQVGSASVGEHVQATVGQQQTHAEQAANVDPELAAAQELHNTQVNLQLLNTSRRPATTRRSTS